MSNYQLFGSFRHTPLSSSWNRAEHMKKQTPSHHCALTADENWLSSVYTRKQLDCAACCQTTSEGETFSNFSQLPCKLFKNGNNCTPFQTNRWFNCCSYTQQTHVGVYRMLYSADLKEVNVIYYYPPLTIWVTWLHLSQSHLPKTTLICGWKWVSFSTEVQLFWYVYSKLFVHSSAFTTIIRFLLSSSMILLIIQIMERKDAERKPFISHKGA